MIFNLIVHHNLKIQLKYTYEECFNEKLDECIYAVNESTHSRQGGAHMSQVNIKTYVNRYQIKFQRYYNTPRYAPPRYANPADTPL